MKEFVVCPVIEFEAADGWSGSTHLPSLRLVDAAGITDSAHAARVIQRMLQDVIGLAREYPRIRVRYTTAEEL